MGRQLLVEGTPIRISRSKFARQNHGGGVRLGGIKSAVLKDAPGEKLLRIIGKVQTSSEGENQGKIGKTKGRDVGVLQGESTTDKKRKKKSSKNLVSESYKKRYRKETKTSLEERRFCGSKKLKIQMVLVHKRGTRHMESGGKIKFLKGRQGRKNNHKRVAR